MHELNKKWIAMAFLCVFLIGIVCASQESLGTFTKGEDIRLRQVCQDATYVNISSVTYPNGSVALSNVQMDSFGSGEYNYTFTDTDTEGTYSFNGISDGCTKTFAVYFTVSDGGVEITGSRSGLMISLLSILVLFFLISLFGVVKVEDFRGKFALYWISHVLFILITFVGWQMGVEGFLGSVALTGIFRILFYVSTVLVFPMVLVSIAWMVYVHTFNEHFERLIEKGEDPETAFAMTTKKKGGWWSGR